MSIPWDRVFRWAFCLVCLILLGAGIYRFEADEPRWTVGGSRAVIDVPIRFSANGTSVYTLPAASFRHGPDPNKLRKLNQWNVATGQFEAQYPTTGRLIGRHAFSKNGRYFAAICEANEIPASGEERFICLVDLQAGDEKQLQIPCSLDEGFVEFSPCGQYFVLGHVNHESPIQIYESATGQLLKEHWCNGLVGGATFTPDYLLFAERDSADDPEIALWSLRERKVVAKLGKTSPFDGVVSANGKLLLANGAKERSWVVWNLHTHQLESRWIAKDQHLHSPQLHLSDERCLAVFGSWNRRNGFVEVWDIGTGKRMGWDEIESWHSHQTIASHGRLLASYRSPLQFGWSSRSRPEPTKLRVLEMPTLKEIWRMDEMQPKSVDFTKDGQRIIVAPMEGSEIQIRDAATGVVKQTISVYPNNNDNTNLTMTPDGKHLCIHHGPHLPMWGWIADAEPAFWRRVLQWVHLDPHDLNSKRRDLTIVYDLQTNRERLRMRGRGAWNAILSDDGTTLVTTHDEDVPGNRVMCCWDVGSTKPWRWPLAIPAIVGTVFWLSVNRMARWRKRRAEVKVPITKST